MEHLRILLLRALVALFISTDVCSILAGVMGRAFKAYVVRHGSMRGVDGVVRCINDLKKPSMDVAARAITIVRSDVDTTRWKWNNILSYKDFMLRDDWPTFDAAGPSPEELMRGSWLVRDYTGNGKPQPLNAGSFTTTWLSVGAKESIELLQAVLERSSPDGRAPGRSRLELLPKLFGAGGLLTDSNHFGDKKGQLYTDAVFVLKHWLKHGYSAAECEAAGVGAQSTPHTLAAAIVQLEARRKLASRAPGAASTQRQTAAGAAVAPVTAGGGGPAGTSTGGGAPASSAVAAGVAPRGSVPQPLLGRHVAGLGDSALVRVRAAVAAAKAGESPEAVARAALLSVLAEVVPPHPDAQAVRAPQAQMDYGEL